MATSIKLPEDLKKRAEKRRGMLADAYAARAEFQRSGTGYALAEVKAHYRTKLQGPPTGF